MHGAPMPPLATPLIIEMLVLAHDLRGLKRTTFDSDCNSDGDCILL